MLIRYWQMMNLHFCRFITNKKSFERKIAVHVMQRILNTAWVPDAGYAVQWKLMGSMGFCRYFVEILQETSDMNEIQFHEDGTWSPLKTSKEHHVISCSPAAHKSSHKESRSSSSSASGTPSGYTVAFIMCVLKDHRFNFITKNQLLFASILFRNLLWIYLFATT